MPGHTVPHAPQSSGSLPGDTHEPAQVCSPWGQAQTPALQAAPAAQAVPQAPQLDESFEVSTHEEPHWTSPTAQADWHAPLEQTRPVSHA